MLADGLAPCTCSKSTQVTFIVPAEGGKRRKCISIRQPGLEARSSSSCRCPMSMPDMMADFSILYDSMIFLLDPVPCIKLHGKQPLITLQLDELFSTSDVWRHMFHNAAVEPFKLVTYARRHGIPMHGTTCAVHATPRHHQLRIRRMSNLSVSASEQVRYEPPGRFEVFLALLTKGLEQHLLFIQQTDA